MKSPLQVTMTRPLHDFSVPRVRGAMDECRTTTRSARTRSPDVDRDQRPKFVGWWRVEYGTCGGCLNGWDTDWIKWQDIWNGNKQSFPQDIHLIGASRWPAQKKGLFVQHQSCQSPHMGFSGTVARGGLLAVGSRQHQVTHRIRK